MKSNYEKLRKLYNDTFYSSGIPFEDGCEIQAEYAGFYINEGGSESYGDIEYQNAVVWKGETVSHQYDIVDGITKDNFEEIVKEGLEDGIKYTNLGKPLTLQDVLRLFEEISCEHITGHIFIDNGKDRVKMIAGVPFHKQPEEVFEKIYQLITN